MKNYKNILFSVAVLIACSSQVKAQDHRFDPPWNTPPESKVMFTVPWRR